MSQEEDISQRVLKVKWEWFEYIPISNEGEGEEERRRKQGRCFLTSKLSLNRSQYQFRAKWQQEKMKTNVDSLPPGHMRSGLFRKNTPFYRYSGHIELIRFKEYYRMPSRQEHISFVFSSTSRDIFC